MSTLRDYWQHKMRLAARQRLDREFEPAQQPLRGAHVVREPEEYLTLDEAVELFPVVRRDGRVPARDLFRRWLHRQAVPILRRGRVILIERRVLEAVLRTQ